MLTQLSISGVGERFILSAGARFSFLIATQETIKPLQIAGAMGYPWLWHRNGRCNWMSGTVLLRTGCQTASQRQDRSR